MEGDITFSLEQDTYHIVPPTLLLIQPGQHHCILTNTVGVPYDRYVFRFNETDLPKELNRALESIAPVSEIKDQHLMDLFLRLDPFISYIEPDFCTEFLKCALTEIIIYLCSSNLNPSTKVITNKEMETIINYINTNLESIFSIDDICDNVFMSRAKVNRLFQDQLHTPPMAYVRGKKCILAKKLLLSGYPLTTLYEKCGFIHYSTFYRAYRWFFGHSPSEEIVSSDD
jgi:AraC-like DNA-binding protein